MDLNCRAAHRSRTHEDVEHIPDRTKHLTHHANGHNGPVSDVVERRPVIGQAVQTDDHAQPLPDHRVIHRRHAHELEEAVG